MKKLMGVIVGLGLVLGSTSVLAGGEEIFKGKCAMCHKADGKKIGKMMSYKGKLTDAEIADVCKYFTATFKTDSATCVQAVTNGK